MATKPTDQRFRFVSTDGLTGRLKARLALSVLVAGGALIVTCAKLGPGRVARSLETLVGGIIERLAGINLEVTGLAHIDRSEQYVVLPLHEGFADGLALMHLPLRLTFAARDELFDWPTLGPYLSTMGHLRVETDGTVSSLRQLYRDAERCFDSGRSLVVFPQGTVLGIEIQFQSGAVRLAKHFDRPILPVVLTGSHRVWEHPFSSRVRFGQNMAMYVLKPVDTTILTQEGFAGLERLMKEMALANTEAPARRYEPSLDGWWDDYSFEIEPAFEELHDRIANHRSTVHDGHSHR